MDLGSSDSVYRRSENPLLGYELKPGYRDPDADASRSYAFTNSHGQRDVERGVERRAGVGRVILLGDSVVEGHDLPRLDDTISRRLERLDEEGGIEVLNFGVSGYCTLAEVELLEVKGLQFAPDTVVLIFVANDFDNFNREAARLDVGLDRPAPIEALFRWSHAFRLLAVRLDLFRYGADVDPVAWNNQAIGDNNVVVGLERLNRLAREHAFVPLIAVWPTFTDDAIVDTQFMPDGSGDLVIERLARAHGIRSVRLSPAFRMDWELRSRDASPRIIYTVGDGLHPSAEGAEIAARALRATLAEGGGFSEPTDPGSAAEAIALAQTLGQNEPDYARVYNNVGLELKGQGQLDQAMQLFRRALEADPGLADAHNNLANALRELGRLDQAIEHYERAVEIDPFVADARFNLGLALQESAEPELAMKMYRETIRVAPGHGEAHQKLGDLLAAGGGTQAAIEHYRLALEVRPDSAVVHGNLGSLLASGGRLNEAIVAFRRALEINPDYALIHRHLGRALILVDRRDEAEVHLREARRLDSGARTGP
jgi:tetratricopeptide (TPR) repeat protein